MVVVGKHRNFKFGKPMQVDHSKSQPTDDKLSLRDNFTSISVHKYLYHSAAYDGSSFGTTKNLLDHASTCKGAGGKQLITTPCVRKTGNISRADETKRSGVPYRLQLSIFPVRNKTQTCRLRRQVREDQSVVSARSATLLSRKRAGGACHGRQWRRWSSGLPLDVLYTVMCWYSKENCLRHDNETVYDVTAIVGSKWGLFCVILYSRVLQIMSACCFTVELHVLTDYFGVVSGEGWTLVGSGLV